MQMNRKHLTLKLADKATEIEAAQRLRYEVFVKEMGATCSREDASVGLERDEFDDHVDHLILLDQRLEPKNSVVAVYRLMQSDVAKHVGYYGASEFDLTKITASGRRALELGRSCVAKEHRGGVAMHMLWSGVANYVLSNEIDIMFGTASFAGVDPHKFAHGLSYLHHNFLAPDDLCVTAQSEAVPIDILPPEAVDADKALSQIPALIQAYMRLGGFIGQGASVDYGFNTTDVCVLLDVARMSDKHRQYYTKKRR